MLNRLFRKKTSPPPSPPSIGAGRRVYAIGDIHGRLDLFARLLDLLRDDNAGRGAAEVELVLLGDLIDRGPDSAGVVRRAMQPLPWARLHGLKGNHEAAMLATLDGDLQMARIWLRNGGDTALLSWGVDPALVTGAPLDVLIEAARAAIPVEERRWIARLQQQLRIGDYHFVHAGVRPGVPLDAQLAEDALWIRDEFLDSKRDHGAVVVHGHSIRVEVEERPNRIGLDTGAYATDRLTAVGLEGADRWFLQT